MKALGRFTYAEYDGFPPPMQKMGRYGASKNRKELKNIDQRRFDLRSISANKTPVGVFSWTHEKSLC